jgi:hypothetical protein
MKMAKNASFNKKQQKTPKTPQKHPKQAKTRSEVSHKVPLRPSHGRPNTLKPILRIFRFSNSQGG